MPTISYRILYGGLASARELLRPLVSKMGKPLMVRRYLRDVARWVSRLFSKRQCQAVTAASGARCPRKVHWHLRYCWQHTQKLPLVLSLLIGVVLKLGVTELYHTAIPSSESRRLGEIGQQARDLQKLGGMQLQTSRFTAALDGPVYNIYVILKLRNPVNFADICPIELGFEFQKTTEKGSLHAVRVKVKDEPFFLVQNDKRTQVSGYKISLSADFPENYNRDFSFLPGEQHLDTLSIPILYGHGFEKDELFRNLRDFHESYFRPYLPKQIISISKDIKLLVNGWVLVESDVDSVYWSHRGFESALFNTSTELSTPWTGDFHSVRPPHGLWNLNLTEIVPNYIGNIAEY